MAISIPWTPSTPGTPEQLNAGSLFKRASIAELEAMPTVDLPAYATEADVYCAVAGVGSYRYSPAKTYPTNGYTIIDANGPGQWLLDIGSGWSLQFPDAAALKSIDSGTFGDGAYVARIEQLGWVWHYIWQPGSAPLAEPYNYTPDDGLGHWAFIHKSPKFLPAENQLPVNQATHGFVELNVIRENGGSWAKAQANAESGCIDCWVVSKNMDTNNFVAVKSGRITIPSHGLTPGATYYLSAASAGALTASTPVGSTAVPLGFFLPVIYVVDTNTIDVLGQSKACKNRVLAEFIPNGTSQNTAITFSNLDLHAIGGTMEFEHSFEGAAANTLIEDRSIRVNGVSTNNYEQLRITSTGVSTHSAQGAFVIARASMSNSSFSQAYCYGRIAKQTAPGVSGFIFIQSNFQGNGITDQAGQVSGRLTTAQSNVTSVTFIGSNNHRMIDVDGHFIRILRVDL